MEKLTGFQVVVGSDAQEFLGIFLDLGDEVLQIEGDVLDFAGLGEETHNMAVPQEKLITDAILSERDVTWGNRLVENVEGQVAEPRGPQGMPLRREARASHMEPSIQEDKAVRFR